MSQLKPESQVRALAAWQLGRGSDSLQVWIGLSQGTGFSTPCHAAVITQAPIWHRSPICTYPSHRLTARQNLQVTSMQTASQLVSRATRIPRLNLSRGPQLNLYSAIWYGAISFTRGKVRPGLQKQKGVQAPSARLRCVQLAAVRSSTIPRCRIRVYIVRTS